MHSLIFEFAVYAAVGSVAGVLSGLLGLGGGIVIVPALVYLFPLLGYESNQVVYMAIGTSHAAIIISSLSSVRVHKKNNHIRWDIFKSMVFPLLVFSMIGSLVATSVSGSILLFLFATFAFLIAIQMILDWEVVASRDLPGRSRLLITGGIIGALSALFGIGGGSLTVPYLHWHNVNIKQAVATSAACGLIIASCSAGVFIWQGLILSSDLLPEYSLGYVYVPALIGIATFSFLSANIGAKLANKIPAALLRKIFGFVLLITGCYLFLRSMA